MAVETSGCGFLPDRRPPILFERHIFHRLTGGRFDDGDISDQAPGGYGPMGAAQYLRLSRAVALDRTAALQSASWGLGQVMGQNCAMAGYAEVAVMVAAMAASEDAQLTAMAAFFEVVKAGQVPTKPRLDRLCQGLQRSLLCEKSVRREARRGVRTAQFRELPDLNVRTAQLYLTFAASTRARSME